MNDPCNGKRIVASANWVTNTDLSDIKAVPFPKGTVVFAKIGEALKSKRFRLLTRPTLIDNNMMAAEALDSVDPEFLYYRLLTADLPALSEGSALPYLRAGDLARHIVAIPPVYEQRAIAEVLGALDDKIEANRRVARSLEERLAAVFAQYGFDAAGDLDSNAASLMEIVDVNPPRGKPDREVASYIDMAALPTDSALVARSAVRERKSGARFVNGDTLMARITPCLENGKVAYVDCLEDTEVGTGSTEFLVLRPREPLPSQFAYFLARSERFSSYAVQHMSGSSGRQRCPAEAIERYKIARPNVSDVRAFGELADPSFALMRANVNESLILASLRDALLPKLLSGELRVRDAESIVGEAV
jgi:type I restriction enzyme S subunit